MTNRIGMNAFRRIETAFVIGTTLLIAGCAVSPDKAAPDAFRMPGGKIPPSNSLPTPGMPGTGAIPGMPGHRQAENALVPDPNKSIAQVGFVDFGASACTNGCCPPSSADSCNQGCNSGSCGPVVPYGYALPPAQDWNIYGADPQEFVCDGGDREPAATVRRDDSIAGLQSEDTVAHYTTDAGDIHVQPSTRACVYSPRFASVRKISAAVAGERVIGLSGIAQPVGPNRFEHQVPGLIINDSTKLAHAEVTRGPDAVRDRNRGVRIEGVIQPLLADEILVVLAALQRQEMGQLRDTDLALIERLANAAVAWTIDESVEVAIEDLKAPTLTRDRKVDALTTYEFPNAGRLQILKLADRAHGQPGEKVSFLIRAQNVGDSAVNHVVLTDNLTTRLQYVDESQTCSVEADFTTEMNEGESLRLQWTLQEELKVGESVEIRFECLLR